MTKDEIKTEEQMVFEFQEALMSGLDIDAALSAATTSLKSSPVSTALNSQSS